MSWGERRHSVWPSLQDATKIGSRCPIPPLPEQTAIARFLDHADRRIQRYIRAKEKLIALLEEQKQVVVQDAVAGRIDVRTGRAYPAYKDSAAGWLGQVPEHWNVLRLGRLIRLTVGFPFKSEGFTESDAGMRLLRGVNVTPGQLRWEEVVRWPADDVAQFSDFRIEPGDIVLGMDRPIIQQGIRVAVVKQSDGPSLLLQRVARIRPTHAVLPDFALRILCGKGFMDYVAPIFTGVSVPHLSPEQINGYRLALPPLAEQQAITDSLRTQLACSQAVIDKTAKQTELLREYRTRLIADVVTGKLDVREAAARLPEIEVPGGGEDELVAPQEHPRANLDEAVAVP